MERVVGILLAHVPVLLMAVIAGTVVGAVHLLALLIIIIVLHRPARGR